VATTADVDIMAARIAEEQLADSRVEVDSEAALSEAVQVSSMVAVEVDSMVVAATAVADTGNTRFPS
jgi:hypothetical protein